MDMDKIGKPVRIADVMAKVQASFFRGCYLCYHELTFLVVWRKFCENYRRNNIIKGCMR